MRLQLNINYLALRVHKSSTVIFNCQHLDKIQYYDDLPCIVDLTSIKRMFNNLKSTIMRTSTTFSILFWIYAKRAKNNQTGIYVRILTNVKLLY